MKKKSKILVTGASGFIGSALVKSLTNNDSAFVVGASRTNEYQHKNYQHFKIPSLEQDIDWFPILKETDVVVHTAGRAHILNDKTSSPLDEFMKVNFTATIKLAEQAISANVKRFIFISSVGVHGDSNERNKPFTEDITEDPKADYALSKLKAEIALRQMAETAAMELVIIRPTLVFDVNAPGNFERLLKIANSILPLPLKGVDNRRSLVSLYNLVDFIQCCIEHKNASGETFLISDGGYVSTLEMVTCLRKGMCRKSNMFYFPNILIKLCAGILKKEKLYLQLFGDLEVNIDKAKSLLGWQPRLSTEMELEEVGKKYRDLKKTDKYG